MEPVIRPARDDDVAVIAGWTRHTFEWGDYIADALPDWMSRDDAVVLVAVRDGAVVGVSSSRMLSPTEAWAQGTRIHPDHRRQGLGMSLAPALEVWAREQGARVMRSMVEDWNEAARSQSLKLGYREVGTWVRAGRAVGENSPVPEGNGGRRVPAAESLRPAHSSEASAALMSWSGGELERAARGLLPVGTWRLRRLTPDDLTGAARNQGLLTGRPGWALLEHREDGYEVPWIATEEVDAGALLRALVDLAADAGKEDLHVMLPAVPWLVAALERRSFETHPLRIYAKPL
jgi:GNAT superfamily N-acetyltransferase